MDQDYQQKSQLVGSNKDGFLDDVLGLNGLVSTFLTRINEIITTILIYVSNILTILTANTMGPGSKAIVKKVFTKIIEMYNPFLEANKKLKHILEKLINNLQF